MWKVHSTFPITQIQGLKGVGGGGINDNNTEISSAGTELTIFQSFQSTFMCPILFEFQKNLLKIYLHF